MSVGAWGVRVRLCFTPVLAPSQSQLIHSSPYHLAPPFPRQSARPQWGEFFAYELVSPAFAVLKITIMDYMRCWRPNLLGQVRSWLAYSLQDDVDLQNASHVIVVLKPFTRSESRSATSRTCPDATMLQHGSRSGTIAGSQWVDRLVEKVWMELHPGAAPATSTTAHSNAFFIKEL